ncbi:MAG: gamma-glutamyl-gamma-aminobutyrate hydrolase family protein [Alphaproteobacteria bacterium]|nr:MAG: gamma-glutamyl-gamma-aminobutyrate hydrolase family protein [Alphaproteobacteria bacterium]
MSKPPLIGVTVDWEAAQGPRAQPWYRLRENYCAAVTRAGGVPVLLAHEPAHAERYLEPLAGLVVTGGHFDIDPSYFGAETRHASVTTKDRRTAFEFAVARAALARDLPVLGICGGQQLLNVILGGTLIQHIPDEVPGALAHEQPNPRDEPGHEVAIVPGTRLSEICGTATMAVNSAHHQAVKDTGAEVTVNARAPDGVIEGIEAPGYRFCIGVQWHPEYALSAADEAIFSAFVAAARAGTAA